MPLPTLPRFKAAERRALVMDLARKSLSFEQIATTLKAQYPDRVPAYYDKACAHRDVKWCLQNIRTNLVLPTEEKREMESQRLDGLRGVYGLKALQGDHKALDSLLKVMDKYALLHGLYKAPKREDVMTADGVMALLDHVNRIWNNAAMALLTPEHQEALFALVQQGMETLAQAGSSMALLMQGSPEAPQGDIPPADTSLGS